MGRYGCYNTTIYVAVIVQFYYILAFFFCSNYCARLSQILQHVTASKKAEAKIGSTLSVLDVYSLYLYPYVACSPLEAEKSSSVVWQKQAHPTQTRAQVHTASECPAPRGRCARAVRASWYQLATRGSQSVKLPGTPLPVSNPCTYAHRLISSVANPFQ